MALLPVHSADEYERLKSIVRANNYSSLSVNKDSDQNSDLTSLILSAPVSDDLKALAISQEHKLTDYVECRQNSLVCDL